jgi:hypothetical protein
MVKNQTVKKNSEAYLPVIRILLLTHHVTTFLSTCPTHVSALFALFHLAGHFITFHSTCFTNVSTHITTLFCISLPLAIIQDAILHISAQSLHIMIHLVIIPTLLESLRQAVQHASHASAQLLHESMHC